VANFSTHLNVASLSGAVLSSLVTMNANIDNKTGFLCFVATIIGGILPDIDHDKSTPLKIMHFIFANLISFLVIYKYFTHLKVLEMILIWFIINLLVGIVFYIFKKTTKHRGMIHSIPTAFLVWFLSSFILYKFFNFDLFNSYLIGMFVFIGFIIHLLLDEIYSVDLTGRKIKKSFGTALKVCSKNARVNLFVYSLLFLALLFLPQKEIIISFLKGIINV